MIKGFIQVEAGSSEKHVYDEETLEFKERRPITQPYPFPYGFILGTRAEDGDCVDCYILTRSRLTAGTIVSCEPLRLLEQFENGEIDHKILAN